ncbi:MAG: N-acetylglucosamine kinase [Ardenticatenaceae bacterium]
MSYFLGVDGGNTKTIALIASADGTVLGAGRGGCGDIYNHDGPEAAFREVEHAVGTALRHAGLRANEILAGCFSMAGADWPEDYNFLLKTFDQRRFGRTITVVNDAIGAVRAGSPDGTGVAVVSGTGTAVGARAPDGRWWSSSFWQEQAGSLELSQRALRAVYRAELEIDPPTSLTPRVLAFFGVATVEEVLHLLTARDHPRPPNLLDLTRILLDEAHAGDPTARRIVVERGRLLGDYALAAARQVGIVESSFPLVLAGGVLRHPTPLLTGTIVARVHASAPRARAIRSHFEPVVGALLLAFVAAQIPVDPSLLARLAATLPPPTLFAT